nr:MAG TPA: portal protein [Caudoviricetes sp.]
MAETIRSRLKRAFNVFANGDQAEEPRYIYGGYASSLRPDRPRFSRGNERSIVTAIFNRIALDVASIDIRHVDLDEEGRYLSDRPSRLNNCLTVEANIDQTSRAFLQDIVMSLMDEGCIAVVPVDTYDDPTKTESYDIISMRVAKIVKWYPQHVTVRLYDDRDGQHKEITIRKSLVAIIENPLYAVVNEPNSTLQRLVRKLSLLDQVDSETASGKLNMIIQLPYTIKSEARRKQADERRAAIEDQIAHSPYGIAYADATEHITQLNRSLDNNLLSQIEYLTDQLYGQLGLTKEIMNGTANEQDMLNYQNRTTEPIIAAIADEFKRKFLTKTGRTQGQSIEYFRDPFRLMPVSQIAEITDKFVRNTIMTPNEMRQKIGMKPAADPNADQLRNPNISASAEEIQAMNDNAGSNLDPDESEVDDQEENAWDQVFGTSVSDIQ